MKRSENVRQNRRAAKARIKRNLRRRLIVENLEERVLLAGLHDDALLASLRTAFDANSPEGIATWSDRLKEPSELGRNLPFLGEALKSRFDVKSEIQSLVSRLDLSYSTLTELRDDLQAISGVSVSTTRDLEDNLELDVRFQITKEVVFL